MKILCFVALCVLLVEKIQCFPRDRATKTLSRDFLSAFIEMQGSCRMAGYTNGCCTDQVCFVESSRCYCDEECHTRNDCCGDILAIGCNDTFTCAAARLSPGCCQGTSCTVYSRNRSCYCDRFCILFNDCCRDVQERTALNCTNRVSQLRTAAFQ